MAPVSTERKRRRVAAPVTTRKKQELVQIVIKGFPLPLKKALIREAQGTNSNMTNVAISALAEDFKVRFYPSTRGAPATPPGDSQEISMRMPIALRRKIGSYASNHDMYERDVVIEYLSRRFL